MENFIDLYFKQEKSGALFLVIAGGVALCMGLYFILKLSDPIYRGIAYPLLLFGLLQAIIGGAVYFRTDKQVVALQLHYQQVPAVLKVQELPRMEKVMRNFKIVKIVEITCIIIGVLCIVFLTRSPFWIGVGIGLLFQAALLLGFDKIAEHRGELYYQQLVAIPK